MQYAAHETLVEPARPSAQLWRLLLGSALIVACFFAMGYSYFNILAEMVTEDHWSALADEIDHGSTPRGMMAILGIFGLLTLSILLVINQLHHRRMRTLFGPPAKAAQDFARVMVALCALGVLLWLLPEPDAMAPTEGLPTLRWVSLLPISLTLVMLQISAEELAFRGYLQSQLAARFDNPVVWIALPALIFGVLHYDPATAGANAPVLALSAFVFGLAAADLTARSGTLGPAIALHFSINVSALLITAPMGHNFGLALQIYPFTMDDTIARGAWLPYDLLVMLCAWLAARLAISR